MKNRLFLTMVVFVLSVLFLIGCHPQVVINEDMSTNLQIPDGAKQSKEDSLEVFNPCDSPNARTLHVPGKIESISVAVAELGDHGRVIVAPGTYHENIEIRPGALIIIQAEGPERPELFAAEAERPVIRVAPKARLCLVGVSVYGTRSGIVIGSESMGEAARAVTLFDTHVTDAEYGIYGLVDRLHIEGSRIENNVFGVAVAGSTSVVDTEIIANTIGVVLNGDKTPSCADAAYSDSGKQVFIQNVNISNNANGGVAICNVLSAVIIDTYVHKNAYIGVQIHNTTKFTLDDLRVGETQLWNGRWGDGLSVVHSSGIVMNSQFSANRRANIIYFGNSGGTIDNNKILYAIFAIHLEMKDGSFPSPTIPNSNYLYGNKENRVTSGLSLAPSEPPDVPPE